jgi:hypothetical protein
VTFDFSDILLEFRDDQENTKDVLNESYKMRMTIAYGLERFWGEHLRLERDSSRKSQAKAKYWKGVWKKLYEILHDAGLESFPDGNVTSNNSDEQKQKIKDMAHRIWTMTLDDQRIALMVLTQFCDSLVWWTQRYKTKGD